MIKMVPIPQKELKSFDNIIQNFLKVKLPSDWNELDAEVKQNLIYKWTREAFPNLPDSLLPITVGWTIDGDSGHSMDEFPDWFDHEKFLRGQKFAQDNLMGIMTAGLICLFGLYSFEDGFKPLIASGRSSEPYTAFKRYLGTVGKIRSWYTSDPWTKGTDAYNELKKVRRVHAMVREKLHTMSDEEVDKAAIIKDSWSPTRDILLEDYRSSCPVALPGQCPVSIDALGSVRFKKLNQGEMALTQGSLICLVLIHPEAFGIHGATDENLDDFCHMWKGIGYLLGIDSEYSFCRGSLEDIKQRSEDYLNQWITPNLRNITSEWEHMMRCIFEGMKYYLPGMSYKIQLLYLMDMMNIDMPRLRSTLSFKHWMTFHIWKILMNQAFKFSIVRKFMNKFFNDSFDGAVRYTEDQLLKLRIRSNNALASNYI